MAQNSRTEQAITLKLGDFSQIVFVSLVYVFGELCYDQHIDFVMYGQAAGYLVVEVM